MAQVKTGSGHMNIMGRDIEIGRGTIGRLTQRLAKAKSGGAGIGGLLGAIIGQILIPIPGVGAAIGGAIGGWGGSKIGGMTSNVDQGDIMGNKFFKGSTVEIAEGIAQQEMTDTVEAAKSGFKNSAFIGGGLEAFSTGAAGGGGFLGGLKDAGKYVASSYMPEGMKDDKSSFSGKDMGLSYGGMDEYLGGILPGGEKLSRGSMGKAFGGLLGPKIDGEDSYSMEGRNEMRTNLMENFGMNLPMLNDPDDWESLEGGREWSATLGKYRDEI